jgi:antitoxin VapB
MRSRAFRSGNSLAVRIPKDLGAIETPGDIEIERVGDALVIRPVRGRSLDGVLRKFAAFPPGFLTEGRGEHEEREREGW